MTSKLNCPFCQQELHKDPDGYYSCYTDNCSVMNAGGNGASGTESLWQAMIQTKQDLEFFMKEQFRNVSALIERTKELDKCQKDLGIARQALEEIKKVCDGRRWRGLNLYDLTSYDGRRIAETTRKALEQIEHKE